MGVTKTAHFSASENELANIFKALAHPARLAILAFLCKQNRCIGNDIVQEIPLAQPTISQHLRELKAVGLIQGEVEGTAVCYCINPIVWNAVRDQINDFFNLIHHPLNCC